MKSPQELYGYTELETLTGVRAGTLRQWALRGKLPDPDFRVGQSPAWLPATIEAWNQNRQKEESNA